MHTRPQKGEVHQGKTNVRPRKTPGKVHRWRTNVAEPWNSMSRGQNWGKCAPGVDILDHRKMKKSRVKLHKKFLEKMKKGLIF